MSILEYVDNIRTPITNDLNQTKASSELRHQGCNTGSSVDVRESYLDRHTRPSAMSLPVKANTPYTRAPSLPTTPLQAHITPEWDKMISPDDSNDFSSLHPFDYEFHATQLEHFLQEYKSLQEELYRMKETAVEAPDEEKRASITTRTSLDPDSDWSSVRGNDSFKNRRLSLSSLSASTALGSHENDRSGDLRDNSSNLKSILKRKNPIHRHSLAMRDFTFDN